MGGWVVFKIWNSIYRPAFQKSESLQWLIKAGATYFAPLSLVLGGYMLLNKLYFGSFMPVSGTIKRWWGTMKYTVYGRPPRDISEFVEEVFSESSNVGPFSIVVKQFLSIKERIASVGDLSISGDRVFLFLGLIVIFGISLILYQQRDFVKKVTWQWNLIPILFSCALHIGYYKGFGQVAQKKWYWILENFFVFLIIVILFESIFNSVLKWKYGNYLNIAIAILILFSILKPHLERSLKVLQYPQSTEEHLYLQSTHWIEEHTEPGSIIGMTGAGSTGYFIQDRTIVNLDGLINSVEYFIHLQNSTADEYFESIGGDYIFGNAYILQDTNPYLWNFDQRLEFLSTYEKVDEYQHWALFRFK
jgi:hypothetical protein